MDLCPHKITNYPQSAGASRSHISSGKYTHIFPPHKVEDLLWGSYCIAHHSHPTITLSSSAEPTVISSTTPPPECREGRSWDAPSGMVHGRWSMGDFHLGQSGLAWARAGRNSNKPTQANPRDIPLWHLILTLTWPNLCLFRDQQTLLATYQETLLRSASCCPAPPLSFRPHSVCASAPTQPENKSLYGE